jgi:hypothetical protein
MSHVFSVVLSAIVKSGLKCERLMVTTRDDALQPSAFTIPSWEQSEYAASLKRIESLMLFLENPNGHDRVTFPGQPGHLETFLQHMPNLTRLRLNFRHLRDNSVMLGEVRRGLMFSGLRSIELGKLYDSEHAFMDLIGQFRNTVEDVVFFKVRKEQSGY